MTATVAVDRDPQRIQSGQTQDRDPNADETATKGRPANVRQTERRTELQALQAIAESLVRATSEPEIARVAV